MYWVSGEQYALQNNVVNLTSNEATLIMSIQWTQVGLYQHDAKNMTDGGIHQSYRQNTGQ